MNWRRQYWLAGKLLRTFKRTWKVNFFQQNHWPVAVTAPISPVPSSYSRRLWPRHWIAPQVRASRFGWQGLEAERKRRSIIYPFIYILFNYFSTTHRQTWYRMPYKKTLLPMQEHKNINTRKLRQKHLGRNRLGRVGMTCLWGEATPRGGEVDFG